MRLELVFCWHNHMRQENTLNQIAARYGFSTEGVRSMLSALIAGHGSMAQFNHADFGGPGQWMAGGMVMTATPGGVGDLRRRIDRLCDDLVQLLEQQQPAGGVALFSSSEPWWPVELGIPTSAGSQNDFAYAYFPAHDRLAIRTGAQVVVYDTVGRRLTGFGQQQPGGAIEIQTTEGPVTLDRLRAVE
jgi:hypothetical protein